MRYTGLILLTLLVSCGRLAYDSSIHTRSMGRPLHITLDAGHGGHDPGALSKDKKTEEKNLALATTLMTKSHLERLGYRVTLTRSSDLFLPLDERADLANEIASDLFVSIHYNASTNKQAEGVEVYRYRAATDTTREEVSDELATAVLTRVLRYTNAPSRGVKQANYSVLRRTNMPAILVEGGFVTNEAELTRLQNSHYLNSIAWGIAQGIHDHVKSAS